ncbi:putative pectinesterase 50, partial [Cucurbita argyrosperma subsp. sororia]
MARPAVASSFPATVALVLAVVQLITILIPAAIVVEARTKTIPAEPSQLDEWIAHNMREYRQRKANETGAKTLDPRLAKAEDCARLITVKQDGQGNFSTITQAIDSIPSGNRERVVVWIGGGTYREKITIDSSKPFVTLYGQIGKMPVISYDGTASEFGTAESATVAVESDYFVAVNVAFVNSAPMPDAGRTGGQAVAMRISGDKAAFHHCQFIGFQDTLCDDRGRHFFKDCYIEGTVDFIFGNGKSLYLKTVINSVAEGTGVITAQARENSTDDSGFTFAYCNITGTGNTYLGRAWKERTRVVFAYTYMGTLINTQGWSDKMQGTEPRKSMYYGEYKCKGPGADSTGRAHYTRILTDDEAKAFLSMTYIHGNKWVLPPPRLSLLPVSSQCHG